MDNKGKISANMGVSSITQDNFNVWYGMMQQWYILLDTLWVISEKIFPSNHLTRAKINFKPNQTATKLQHTKPKQQIYKKSKHMQTKTEHNETKPGWNCGYMWNEITLK